MPVLLLVLGALTLVVAARRRGARRAGAPLSDDEKDELDKLLRP
ncbi:cytochrome c-type biogenesis protein CcmH/NrfF [Sinorhizobium fredii]